MNKVPCILFLCREIFRGRRWHENAPMVDTFGKWLKTHSLLGHAYTCELTQYLEVGLQWGYLLTFTEYLAADTADLLLLYLETKESLKLLGNSRVDRKAGQLLHSVASSPEVEAPHSSLSCFAQSSSLDVIVFSPSLFLSSSIGLMRPCTFS